MSISRHIFKYIFILLVDVDIDRKRPFGILKK